MPFWGDSGGFLDDDEEENDETSTSSWTIGRDGLIFLIDASEQMFQKPDGDDETAFEICIRCAHNVLMSKIISCDKDLIGIIFFGTEKHKNNNDFKNIFNFQELDLPDAKRILELEHLREPESIRSFSNEYGHSRSFSLSDALWSCSNMFANTSYKISQKRILLFTSTDNPHADDREARKRALKKAKDLLDLGIELELLHLKHVDQPFNVDLFYRNIISDEDYNALCDPSDKFDELLTRLRMKEYKKRAITRLPLNLSDDISLGVAVYTMNRAATKGSYVKVDSRSNEEIKTVTKYICHDTGQVLFPTDLKYYQEFGGEKVIYEKEEVGRMKGMVKPGFHLLGFKPRKFLKDYYHVKPCSFIYPDESNITGSTTLFSALLKRCLARDVMPICILSTRPSTPPRFTALLAQEELLDENRVQIKPPGFYVLYLPYSDDIRKVKMDTRSKASYEQIDKTKEIIDKLKFQYRTEMFENPAIQKFYRCLEAFALDRDEVEEFEDLTMPNNEAIDQKAGNVIKEFKELVFPNDYGDGPSGTKRKASSTNPSAKKKKSELTDVNIEEAARKGNLKTLTVPVLKTFCQANNIKTSSQRKGDLIKAINDHFGI